MCLITSTVTIGALSISAAVANTMLAVGAVATIASTALGTVSSVQQGKQQQAMYNYQAKVAEENAKIAQKNAATERQTGIEEARLQRIKTLQAVGSQQAAMAANGMDVTQGTSLDIIEDTAAMGELDALQIQTNYERKALSYEQQALNFENEANMDVISGKNAYSAGKINAVNTGLNGVSELTNVATKWYGFGGGGSTSGTRKYKTRVSGGVSGDNITFA